jgi:hypothetical protein
MLSVSGLDPDGAIKAAVREIYPEAESWPYRAAEDLAEQGVEILRSCMEGEDLSFAQVMTRLREANPIETADQVQKVEGGATSESRAKA